MEGDVKATTRELTEECADHGVGVVVCRGRTLVWVVIVCVLLCLAW